MLVLHLVVSANLDVIQEAPVAQPELSKEDQQLETLLNYERFRSIVEGARIGLSEEKHIARVASILRYFASVLLVVVTYLSAAAPACCISASKPLARQRLSLPVYRYQP